MYRAFISYSHLDKQLVTEIITVLSQNGITPLWDEHILAGVAFTDVIKDMLAFAHIFIPIITKNSQNSLWVQQEIGYANALNIPILPIAVDMKPSEMISSIQAIQIKTHDDLKEQLKSVSWDKLIIPYANKTISQIQIAEWPETRTELLVKHLEKAITRSDYGKVRIQARLGTFSLPKDHYFNDIWAKRDGETKRSDYLHYLQSKERIFTEEHVWHKGCRLLVDPKSENFNTSGIEIRLQIFKEFLESIPENKIEIVFSERAHDKNLIIIGDIFVAESRIRSQGVGYLHTLFHSHPPTVLQYIRQYDQLFDEEVRKSPMTIENAITEVNKYIEIAKEKGKE